jgi:hypothetical protein
MQPETPKIHFANQADVWSKAEHRRAEDIACWLGLAFRQWVANSTRRWRLIFDAVQLVSTAPRNGEPRRARS